MELPELEEMKEAAELWVSEGYDAPEEMAEGLLDRFELDSNPENRMIAWSLLNDALREHAQRQARWPEETDCDRLDRAFARLEEAGVIARQNFTCCNTWGCHEIRGEVASTQADGRLVRGYVFFHTQATEQATRGGGLWLNYGPSTPCADDRPVVQMGREIEAILRAEGLNTRWSGKASDKIVVEMTWQRRRALPRLSTLS